MKAASKPSRSKRGSGVWCSPAQGSPATCPAIACSSCAAAWSTRWASMWRASPCAARPKCSWTRFATTGATAGATWPCRPRGCSSTGPGSRRRTSTTSRGSASDGTFKRAVDTPRRFRDLKRSPDGRSIAVVLGIATDSDLWSVDASGTLSRLSFGLSPYRPTWTADGRGITVGARKDGKWRLLTIPADGTGEPAVLLESQNRLYPNAWSPDGRHLLFQEIGAKTGWDLHSLEVDATGRPVGTPKGVRGVAVPRIDRGDLERRPVGRLRIGRARRRRAGVRPLMARRRPQGSGHRAAARACPRGAPAASCTTGRPARTCCG